MSGAPAGELRGAHLHFDCAAGIAGDMTVAALVDLGVPREIVQAALAALPLSGYRVAFERVMRGALEGEKFRVVLDSAEAADPPSLHHPRARDPHDHEPHERAPDHDHDHHDQDHDHNHDHDHGHHDQDHHDHHPHHDADGHEGSHDPRHAHGEHRHYREIRRMVDEARLAPGVRSRALDMFDRIAVVEARLHGVAVAEVAFHEVGAIDSIVDIVATAAALDWLAPARVTSRVVPLGHGSIRTAHGLLPLPGPATLELLRGALVEDGGAAAELTTPTGAAILAACVAEYGPPPAMRVLSVGWGAGDRELPDRPNLLRVIAGRAIGEAVPAGGGELCELIEATVDDLSPELLAPLPGDLIEAGARDAWITNVLMKKGRPGWVVSALVDPSLRVAVEEALFRGSTTIGVRRHAVSRTVLPRRMCEVATAFGPVPIKVAGEGTARENAAPEWEACRRLAAAHRVPVKRVYAEALAAYYRR